MDTIIRYKKLTDEYTTHRLLEPYDNEGNSPVIDLGEFLNRFTYVLIPDGVTLPAQTLTIEPVTIDQPTIDMIRAESKAAVLLQHREDNGATIYAPNDFTRVFAFEDLNIVTPTNTDFNKDFNEDFH